MSRNTEAFIQIEIVATIRKIPGAVIFSVNNESSGNNVVRQGQFIRLGLLAGVSDLVILYRGKTIFMEVKAPTGKQSPAQMRFQAKVEAQGFLYCIVRSVEESLFYIKSY